MKKASLLSFVLAAAALVGLAGCARLPATAADGTPWSKDWITMGNVMGVEQPGHGLTLRDDKAARQMYYAAWSIGETHPYTNSDGQETSLYDAQLALLLADAGTADAAQNDVDQWLGLAAESYVIGDTVQQTYNGQDFTVLTYTFPEGEPFDHGVSAFAAFGSHAVSAELACQGTFEEDAGEILADFLEHCHYAQE